MIFTQKDIDAFQEDEFGTKNFPPMSVFSGKCYFSSMSCFGFDCKFVGQCSFVENCSFSHDCKFIGQCSFGDYCTFDEYCEFEGPCYFGELCRFIYGCHFIGQCRFNVRCTFGDYCTFSEGCIFEGKFKAKTDTPFISMSVAGASASSDTFPYQGSTSYFFDFEEGIYVRSGNFLGTLDEFMKKLLKDDESQEKNDIKTLRYLGFANIAAVTFGGEVK